MPRNRRAQGFELNLDPLTDMVANTVGILIFVLIFAVLSARGVDFKLPIPVGPGSPLSQQTNKDAVQFLCSGNTIRPYNLKSLVKRIWDRFPSTNYWNIARVVAKANQGFELQDSFYHVRCHFNYKRWVRGNTYYWRTELDYLIVEPLRGVGGDGVAAVKDPKSKFRRELARLNKARQCLTFVLDAESVEVFRAAREVALKAGFDVGWEFGNTGWPKPVFFASGGGSGSQPVPAEILVRGR